MLYFVQWEVPCSTWRETHCNMDQVHPLSIRKDLWPQCELHTHLQRRSYLM
ncbi:unnamed protein product [Cylicostephanus goldi]|uniref:Uncharacterized protein n=1 Tax=Cylicostephanus goldi TaxID=71465 RepID=A0A3P6SB66_CYLGO|nr:unnamed protein product [Cylicostephanus goldi]